MDDIHLNAKKGSEHRTTITDITSPTNDKSTSTNRAKTPQPFHNHSPDNLNHHTPSRSNPNPQNPNLTLPLPRNKSNESESKPTAEISTTNKENTNSDYSNDKESKSAKTSTLPVKIRDPQILRQLTSDGKAEKPITRQATDINSTYGNRRPTEGMPKIVISISLADDSQTYKFMVTADFTVNVFYT